MSNRYETLVQKLAEVIATNQLEINKAVYKEQAESLSGEGVTESSYMKDGEETVEWFCQEPLVEDVYTKARDHYRKLVKEKYSK